jgi:carbamoyltransferase
MSRWITNETTHLCLSGGTVLNSVFTGKIWDWFPHIKDIYIPPVPYDAGLAIGCGQYVLHTLKRSPRVEWCDNATPYLGVVYSEEEVREALSEYDEIIWTQASNSEICDLLMDENIVSVYGGGSESGRRALGNRSILADPRNPNMKDIVNEKVKHRQWFRPFAPSIMREEVSNWFTRDVNSPYMGFVLQFKKEKQDLVPAVVHFDGSARLQTVTKNDNEWYYNFLSEWNKKSGVPIILNTSFNDREPIVERPQHAINCFLKTNIDHLYFFDYGILVSKK